LALAIDSLPHDVTLYGNSSTKLEDCIRRISDFLFVAPAVGISFEVIEGPADPFDKLNRTCR
jgi:hypothetical protein